MSHEAPDEEVPTEEELRRLVNKMMEERKLRRASTAPEAENIPSKSTQNTTPQSSVLSIFLGLATGCFLGLFWLTTVFLWNKFVVPLFIAMAPLSTTPKNWDGKAQFGVDLIPAFFGGIIFYIGITKAMQVIGHWKLNTKLFSWSSAIVSVTFALIYAAFMFMLAYSSSGMASLYAAFYGALIMACSISGAAGAIKRDAA